jgi:hypothetical protein
MGLKVGKFINIVIKHFGYDVSCCGEILKDSKEICSDLSASSKSLGEIYKSHYKLNSEQVLNSEIIRDIEIEILQRWHAIRKLVSFDQEEPFFYELACLLIEESDLSDAEKKTKKARLTFSFTNIAPYISYKETLGLEDKKNFVYRGDSRKPDEIFKSGFSTTIIDYASKNCWGITKGFLAAQSFFKTGWKPSQIAPSFSLHAISCDMTIIGASCFPMSNAYTEEVNKTNDDTFTDITYVYIIDPKLLQWLDVYKINMMMLDNPLKEILSFNETAILETFPTAVHIPPSHIKCAYEIERKMIKHFYKDRSFVFWADSFIVKKVHTNQNYKSLETTLSPHEKLEIGKKYSTGRYSPAAEILEQSRSLLPGEFSLTISTTSHSAEVSSSYKKHL